SFSATRIRTRNPKEGEQQEAPKRSYTLMKDFESVKENRDCESQKFFKTINRVFRNGTLGA
ncbi:MAG TPA: hypothetical protein VMB47_04925, partial [Candidatus Aquilonibacter sp.]|nr:hypothetical protein [Candidatus Aquilonibacter sp.]